MFTLIKLIKIKTVRLSNIVTMIQSELQVKYHTHPCCLSYQFQKTVQTKCETELVFIQIKIEQYATGQTIDISLFISVYKLSRLNSFLDQRINTKHTSKIYFL